jgi:S1-C subfamily serine protease
LLFPYPHPKIFGLIMDPQRTSTVALVEPDSPAARDGFLAGDEIAHLDGQSILSIADIQWVLHNVRGQHSLKASISRNGDTKDMGLTLAPGWRTRGDISWRATSWGLRRMTTGGMRLHEAPPEVRAQHHLGNQSMALVVAHLGQFGEHAHAKNQGFKKGDLIASVAGESMRMRESDVFALLVNRSIGERIPVHILRGSKPIELSLVMQK